MERDRLDAEQLERVRNLADEWIQYLRGREWQDAEITALGLEIAGQALARQLRRELETFLSPDQVEARIADLQAQGTREIAGPLLATWSSDLEAPMVAMGTLKQLMYYVLVQPTVESGLPVVPRFPEGEGYRLPQR